MSLFYNLTKVYEVSADIGFVKQIVAMYLSEIPVDVLKIEEGINEIDYKKTYAFAHKIKATLDLLGMHPAYDNILKIENWTKMEGKIEEVLPIFNQVKEQVIEVARELKKDFP